MKSSINPIEQVEHQQSRYFWLDKVARRLVKAQLSKIQHGEIVIREQGQESYFGQATEAFPVRVHLDVMHSSVWSDVAFGGSSGSGEAYIKGSWRCNNLLGLVRIFLRNRDVLEDMDNSLARLKGPVHRILHWLSRNTRTGSRRNISAHYDLGNDLFELFLDPTMMYSCAYYKTPDMSLDQAAVAKIDRICKKLELTPDDHLLEIGTGWGGFAIHAAKHYGCRVTTTTISREQYELAQQRVQQEGLQDKITLLFKDYRDLQGQYDKLVSIEMIEAIGHQYLDTYFEKCSSLLKPNGMMLLQAITIADHLYDSALRDVDYIKKFIFPGGFLPSIAAMSSSIAKVSDMKMFHLDDMGPHYAKTLADWRERFFDRIQQVRDYGYSDAFIRMWEYYLNYCEGGFLERDIGTVQMLLTKPSCRRNTVSI
ncbi:MAG: cyclopropane-fatty-acyl-phospholipid synthase family protein [Gammaproteobacteria bacterium]|nr:cyclopropane-fatty-acyl-phospholipid synthase family protein [Gammaproteobacteria bacterium]